MNHQNIDRDTFLSLIKNLDKKEQRMYINLYKNYNISHKIFNIKKNKEWQIDNKEDIREYLNSLENKVYTINGRVITDKERILLEMQSILKYLLDCDKIPFSLKKEIIIELDNLGKLYSEDKCNTPEMYQYFKEKISIIQALLGLNIKFFNAAYNVFLDKFAIITINKKRKKNN